jgi:hypothetical protein
MRRLLCGAALLLASCAGCNGEPRVVAVLHWGGFRPGCLALRATPAGAAQPTVTTFVLDQPSDRAGDRMVTVYTKAGEGPQVDLVAEAMERGCDADGGVVVARATEQASAGRSGPQVTMGLAANDVDDDGYISNQAALPGTDCREGNANIHPKPGGETLCDGEDDDCNGAADDTNFHVGDPCASGPCQGAVVCNGLLDTRCSAALGDFWEDKDLDQYGGRFLGTTCGPDAGLAADGGDCNDDDPAVHPGALEVCNGKDDDCNGTSDDFGGTCARSALPAVAGLVAVSAAQPGRAWAAGRDGGLYILSADGGVINKSGACGGNDWLTVWVDAQDRAYLGGPLSHVAYADATAACTTTTISPAAQVNGAWGYPRAPTNASQAFFVTAGGDLQWWVPPGSTVDLYSTGASNNMRALDGVPPYPLLSAGWYLFGGVTHPQVWKNDGAGFIEVGAEPLVGTGRQLVSVRMPRADLAYVCGDKGTVLTYNGASWSKLPAPSTELPDLTSVTAFDEAHVYVAGTTPAASYLWSWNGSAWKELMRVDADGGDVRAVGGTGPGDLWVVGKSNAWHLSVP